MASTDEEDTDTKLAILTSLHTSLDTSTIFETLIEADGSVEVADQRLRLISGARASPSPPPSPTLPPAKRQRMHEFDDGFTVRSVPSQQLSIRKFHVGETPLAPRIRPAKKGQTLHLYDADDIAAHTPCSIIHNFLPAEDANVLLKEMLEESKSFSKVTFKLFDREVSSPHTSTFYVGSEGERRTQTKEYVYNGFYLDDVRRITPQLARIAAPVEEAVNKEVQKRIAGWYPSGKKLKFQSSERWKPNCAFVNCYDGGKESVGAHSDQLTYLGPRAVIGSLSLGVAREFRVRRIFPKEEPALPLEAQCEDSIDLGEPQEAEDNNAATNGSDTSNNDNKDFLHDQPVAKSDRNGASDQPLTVSTSNHSSKKSAFLSPKATAYFRAPSSPTPKYPPNTITATAASSNDDSSGAIAIHLPHNSLLVMHAEMQEEWKHSIAPAAAAAPLQPHPIAGLKRINVTYRWYRPEFHPGLTPRCRCDMPAVLRCVQRRRENHGRYMWMCYVNYAPGRQGCGFFKWAVFDDDGRPEWAWGDKRDVADKPTQEQEQE